MRSGREVRAVSVSGDRLLTIGEFSKLSQISIRMLRYYDEHGVLAPTSIDSSSGYRRYHPELLETARWIRRLRDLGVGVAELAACAGLVGDAQAMLAILDQQRERLQVDADAIAAQLNQIDQISAELAASDLAISDLAISDLAGSELAVSELAASAVEDSATAVEIAWKTMPQRTVASLRGRIGTYAEEGRLWEQLFSALPAAGAQVAARPLSVAVFHDDGYVESDPDVEVQLDVVAPFVDGPQVRCVPVPEREVVFGTLRGGYEGTGAVLAALGRWTCARGYRLAGAMFNIYVIGPGQDPDPSNWVTEVCVPVTPDPLNSVPSALAVDP